MKTGLLKNVKRGMAAIESKYLVACIAVAAPALSLAQAATATAKLSEIDKKLTAIKGNSRAEKARTYVKDQIRRIKVASIEAI